MPNDLLDGLAKRLLKRTRPPPHSGVAWRAANFAPLVQEGRNSQTEIIPSTAVIILVIACCLYTPYISSGIHGGAGGSMLHQSVVTSYKVVGGVRLVTGTKPEDMWREATEVLT